MKGNPVPHRELTGFTGQKMENITTEELIKVIDEMKDEEFIIEITFAGGEQSAGAFGQRYRGNNDSWPF